MQIRVVGLASLMGLGIALAAAGQQPISSSGSVQLAGQIELARLVDVAAQRLGVTVEYDPAVLKGSITLRSEGELSGEALWGLTNAILAAHGFTTVRLADHEGVSVVRIAEAAALARVEHVENGTIQPSLAGFRSVVVALAHRDPRSIVDAVGRILSKSTGSVTPLENSNLVGVADLAPRVDDALRLIVLLDTPATPPQVVEIPVANVPPQQLAALVGQLKAKRELVGESRIKGEVMASPSAAAVLVIAPREDLGSWRDLIASLDKRERVETVSYPLGRADPSELARLIGETVRPLSPEDDRWRVVQDTITGSLIVTATPTQHAAVREFLDRLHALPEGDRRAVRSFVVRNRKIAEVASIVESLLQTGTWAEPTGESPVLPEGSSEPPRAAEVTLTVDEGTSRLIVLGPSRTLDRIASIVQEIDVRQSQVMLEVLMVSLTDSQTLDLGVELEKIEVSGGTLIRLSSLFGLSTRGAGGALSPGDGAGFTGVVLDPGEFAVVLRALERLNHGRSLSMPKLLIANNEHATLDSVLQQPFASVNASDTVATTSFGGTQDAGTQVSIQPQIAEGDHLLLDYTVSLSSFVGASSDPNLPPPKQENKVKSMATIPDGYTVVVGGIELTTEGQSISQVPLLGDIPILGEAFKSRSKSSNRQRFYVFIRANILRARGFEDLKYASDVDAADAGVDDGWPQVRPQVMRE